VWILESDGQPAGYVVLCIGFSLEYGGLDAFVDDLFVRPACRRRGLGRTALAELFEECRRRGVRAVHLEVGRDNDAARALYARFGFRDQDRQLLTMRLPRDPDGRT
jgi:ribosomal protein S18 acetylase RimI-like enzyme